MMKTLRIAFIALTIVLLASCGKLISKSNYVSHNTQELVNDTDYRCGQVVKALLAKMEGTRPDGLGMLKIHSLWYQGISIFRT